MRLTTRGRYAVTAMLDIAMHAGKVPVSLADIAGRQQISLPYLEQLFARLRAHRLVRSVRGPGGGYFLNRSSSEIYIDQIVDAVDEKVDSTNCGGSSDCQGGFTCLTHHLWAELSGQIRFFLSRISLASLARRSEMRAVFQRQCGLHKHGGDTEKEDVIPLMDMEPETEPFPLTGSVKPAGA